MALLLDILIGTGFATVIVTGALFLGGMDAARASGRLTRIAPCAQADPGVAGTGIAGMGGAGAGMAMALTPHGAPPNGAPPNGARTLASDGTTDLAEEMVAALLQARAAAGRAGVRLVSALEPGLVVRGGVRPVREVLEAMLAGAIAATPCGEVLATARRQGANAVLAVLDDGGGADAPAREAFLRDAARAIALRGGSLEISAAGTEGVTVALRLPLPSPAGRATAEGARATVAPAIRATVAEPKSVSAGTVPA